MKDIDAILEEIDQISDQLYSRELDIQAKEKLYDQYLELLEIAAKQGSGKAQFELGQTYEDTNFWGVNPNHDPAQCFYWYTKACTNNDADACNSLAIFYDSGIVVKKDLKMALALFEKADNLGNHLAKENHRLVQKELRIPPIFRGIYRFFRRIFFD